MNRFRFLFSLVLAPLASVALAANSGSAALAPSADAVKPLAAGDVAPAVSVRTIEDAEFPLAPAFAAQPTILVFYRGSWCPYCNRHLAALGELEPQLLALGYQIVAVSPDSAAGLKQMADKNHLNYRLLSDRGLVAAAAFGVAFRVPAEMEKSYREHGVTLPPIPGGAGAWLPVPAVFIVDRAGVIRFAHANADFKVLISSAELLAAAKAAAEKK